MSGIISKILVQRPGNACEAAEEIEVHLLRAPGYHCNIQSELPELGVTSYMRASCFFMQIPSDLLNGYHWR
jgi:hypothetical protein